MRKCLIPWSSILAWTQLTDFCLHRVTGPEMFGPNLAVAQALARTVSRSIVIMIMTVPDSFINQLLSSVVNNNPTAFNEAYWAIDSLRVYTAQ
jgi:hypothetical protein